MATVFMSRGIAYNSLNKLNEAIEDYNKAIEIREALDKDDSVYFDRNDLAIL